MNSFYKFAKSKLFNEFTSDSFTNESQIVRDIDINVCSINKSRTPWEVERRYEATNFMI
jgi:hypothetical protein